MHIKLLPGTFAAIVGIGGMGAGMMSPEHQRLIGGCLIAIAIGILIFSIRFEDGRFLVGRPNPLRSGWWILRRHIPILEAARLAYEAAERAGVVDMTTHPTSPPEVRLKFYIYVFFADDETTLYGAKPPSTKSLPIPRDEQKQLHPVDGENKLDYISPHRVGYVNVTIRRRDLNRIVREWPAKSKDFARNFAKTLK